MVSKLLSIPAALMATIQVARGVAPLAQALINLNCYSL